MGLNYPSDDAGDEGGVGRKPGSVEGHHSSGCRVATTFKQPTREQRGPRITFPYLVLLQAGFTKSVECCHRRGALLPHPFTLAYRRDDLANSALI